MKFGRETAREGEWSSSRFSRAQNPLSLPFELFSVLRLRLRLVVDRTAL